jgi:Concanavalin A-like lectin/glucanases superfamily
MRSIGCSELVFALAFGLAPLGCAVSAGNEDTTQSSWQALMDDGDASSIAPNASTMAAPPPRFCSDCTSVPLASWTFDDCNTLTTALADTAFDTPFPHPAFRSVSTACAAGIDNQAVKIAGDSDLVYAPDQPDFIFDQGLTLAAWINPSTITGTQSIVRKRFDGTSSFLLAIDGKQLSFVLRLDHNRLIAISAPLKAKRFTHVAATYDGQQALLYLDGVVAARAKAKGTIVPGVGPIFIGNDANDRKFNGIVDDVWLNTLAAPADEIRNLSCIRQPPTVSISPSMTPPEVAGTTVPFDVAVSNVNAANCPADQFELEFLPSFPLTSDSSFNLLSVAPGQTAHTSFNVKSSKAANVGTYPVDAFAFYAQTGNLSGQAEADYVVGTGPVSCDGSPLFSPQLTGGPGFSGPVGSAFTFAAPGLTAPVVTEDPSTQALQVSVDTGTTTDPLNAFVGFGFPFINPPCADASAFTGVTFTVTGDLGNCALRLSLVPSEDNSTAFGPEGVCTASQCFGPLSAPLTTGTTTVHFTDLTGGSPVATVDPTALNDIQWTLNVPTDGTACVANFTVSDVSFSTN